MKIQFADIPNLSWTDSRLEVRSSPVQGKGVFAHKAIAAGENVVVLGGSLFSKKDIAAGKARPRTIVAIDEGVYLAGRVGESYQTDDYINHCCTANLGFCGPLTLVAMHDLAPNQELSLDYSLLACDDEETFFSTCLCGSPKCRGNITGADWKIKALQQRYYGFFPPFLEKRILAATL